MINAIVAPIKNCLLVVNLPSVWKSEYLVIGSLRKFPNE